MFGLAQLLRRFKRSPTVDERLTEHWKILETRNYSAQTLRLKKHYGQLFSGQYGRCRIDTIQRLELSQWLHERAKTTPSHTRSVRIFVHDFFHECVADGLLTANPAERIKLPPIVVERKRLSETELLAILRRIPKKHYMGRAIKLALTTGQRRADIAKMRFDDVHDGYLRVMQTKNQRKRMVRLAIPLTIKNPLLEQTLGEIIDECRRHSKLDTLLQNCQGNPVTPSQLSVTFARYRDCKNRGEPSFHELRSLSERTYRKIGINTQILLGHKSASMTDEYNDPRNLEAYRKVELPENESNVR